MHYKHAFGLRDGSPEEPGRARGWPSRSFSPEEGDRDPKSFLTGLTLSTPKLGTSLTPLRSPSPDRAQFHSGPTFLTHVKAPPPTSPLPPLPSPSPQAPAPGSPSEETPSPSQEPRCHLRPFVLPLSLCSESCGLATEELSHLRPLNLCSGRAGISLPALL